MTDRKIVGQRTDADGNVTHYKLDGKEKVTPIRQVNNMAKKNEIKNVHAYGDKAVRSDPNSKVKDNLGNLPEC